MVDKFLERGECWLMFCWKVCRSTMSEVSSEL